MLTTSTAFQIPTTLVFISIDSNLKLDTPVSGLFFNSLVTLSLKNDRTLFQSSNFERSGFYSRNPVHLSLHNIRKMGLHVKGVFIY